MSSVAQYYWLKQYSSYPTSDVTFDGSVQSLYNHVIKGRTTSNVTAELVLIVDLRPKTSFDATALATKYNIRLHYIALFPGHASI